MSEVSKVKAKAKAKTDTGTDTEALWREFHGRLLAFLRGRVASREDAEDILQDLFARIHERAPHLKAIESVSGFVFRTARNAVTDYHRRRATAAKAASAIAEAPLAAVEEGDAEKELATCIEPLLDRLPENFRSALELTELRELTQREAAERLGLSTSGVKSRVGRGRQKLKELLLDCCHVELDRRRGVLGYAPRRDCACSCGRSREAGCGAPQGHER